MGLFDILKNKSLSKKKVGDSIFFGKYFYENKSDLKEIEWLLLDSNDTEMLLISKYCLDTVAYCKPSPNSNISSICIWENSYLKNWLNGDFYNQAFNDKEKQRIVETTIITDDSSNEALHKNKVFVLSEQQVCKYFSEMNSRIGFPTPYALGKGANTGLKTERATWWWVLPHIDIGGGTPPRMDYPQVVCQNGEVNFHSRLVYHSDYTVRPVIRIKK